MNLPEIPMFNPAMLGNVSNYAIYNLILNIKLFLYFVYVEI